jgi:ElaB/YqjD/DUF883 family membrane-anchored ribosome-binding protein
LGCVATVGLTLAACGGGSSGVSTSSGSSQANTAYCNQARQVQQAGATLAADPNQLSNAFATFDKLAAVAPRQIAPSVQTLTAFYHRVLSALGSNSPTNQTALKNAENTALSNQQSQLQAAGQQVTTYTKKTCNIDLSGSSSGSTTTAKP